MLINECGVLGMRNKVNHHMNQTLLKVIHILFVSQDVSQRSLLQSMLSLTLISNHLSRLFGNENKNQTNPYSTESKKDTDEETLVTIPITLYDWWSQ